VDVGPIALEPAQRVGGAVATLARNGLDIVNSVFLFVLGRVLIAFGSAMLADRLHLATDQRLDTRVKTWG
jgi:hypothetical protein